MATTKEFRGLEDEFKVRVFVSTLNSAGKCRVIVMDNPSAKNKNDEGDILFQEIYSSWRYVPSSDLTKINAKCQSLNLAQ